MWPIASLSWSQNSLSFQICLLVTSNTDWQDLLANIQLSKQLTRQLTICFGQLKICQEKEDPSLFVLKCAQFEVDHPEFTFQHDSFDSENQWIRNQNKQAVEHTLVIEPMECMSCSSPLLFIEFLKKKLEINLRITTQTHSSWTKCPTRIRSRIKKEECVPVFLFSLQSRIQTIPEMISKNEKRWEPLLDCISYYGTSERALDLMHYFQSHYKIENETDDWIQLDRYHYDVPYLYCQHAYRYPSLGKQLGLLHCDRLKHDVQRRMDTHQIQFYYLEPWSKEYKTHIKLRPKDLPRYHPCNPSILQTKNGYLINCRLVNYSIDSAGRYHMPKEDNYVVKTENVFMWMDQDMKLKKEQLLKDVTNRPILAEHIRGCEDVRIFQLYDKIYASSTVCDNHVGGYPLISLLHIDSEKGEIQQVIPTVAPTEGVQKNWLPFCVAEKLCFIYNTYPIHIIQTDVNTGKWSQIYKEEKPKWNLSECRGSSSPIEYKNGYLYLVHEVTVLPNETKRHYAHRWIYLNAQFQVECFSLPFYFLHNGIEFSCGLCWHHKKESVWVTLGCDDSSAHVLEIPISEIEKRLYK